MRYKGYNVVPLKKLPKGVLYISKMHAWRNNKFTLEVMRLTDEGLKRETIIAVDFLLSVTGYHCPDDIPELTFRAAMHRFCGAGDDTLMSPNAQRFLKEYKSFFKTTRV